MSKSGRTIRALIGCGVCAMVLRSARSLGGETTEPSLYPDGGMIRSDGDFYALLLDLPAIPDPPPLFYPHEGAIRSSAGTFRASFRRQPEGQPFQEQPLVEQPAEPVTQASTPAAAAVAGLDVLSDLAQSYSTIASYESEAGKTSVVEATGPGNQPTSDIGELLSRSETVQSVQTQRRSPVSFDPRIRGFRDGQVFTQGLGANWLPVRQDLDTVLSKLDPGVVQQVVVIPGPYGLRYGAGFSFIDVIKRPTPRYCCGGESHARLGVDYLENGDQWYGRASVFGGGSNYGYRFSYGHRIGSDYDSGNNTQIPSSYKNRNVLGEMSFDITPYQHIEFDYLRLDQTDVEYPLQVYDTRFLVTDGYSVRLVDEDPAGPWDRLEVSGWHNRTRFEGDTSSSAKQTTVTSRIENALAGIGLPGTNFESATDGDVQSTGGRGSVGFGEVGGWHLRAGGDFRYANQQIQEQSTTTSLDPTIAATLAILGLDRFNENMPRARMTDAGAYSELSIPVTEKWIATLGARVDWVQTNANASEVRTVTLFNQTFSNLPVDELVQNDVLYAFYLTNEIELGGGLTTRLGFGHAQRAPTLTERYADGLFLGIIQSGFTRTIGDPNLDKERNWQIDAGLRLNRDYVRANINGFHAWIIDYATLRDNVVLDPVGARSLKYVNTPLATLAGGSMQGEIDLLPRLTAFGSLAYVDGRDRTINQPLFQISPLGGRAGLRLHDGDGGGHWGLSLAARIVDEQNRLGTIRQGSQGGVTILEQRTPGFTVWDLNGYLNVNKNFRINAGILNVFDKNYLEHLSLRFPASGAVPAVANLSPGFTPFVRIERIF